MKTISALSTKDMWLNEIDTFEKEYSKFLKNKYNLDYMDRLLDLDQYGNKFGTESMIVIQIHY